jgi:hypothetical protein
VDVRQYLAHAVKLTCGHRGRQNGVEHGNRQRLRNDGGWRPSRNGVRVRSRSARNVLEPIRTFLNGTWPHAAEQVAFP